MARTTKSKAVATWDEELARQAEIAASMEESSGGGQFFSLKSGILSWNDAPLPGNQMVVIILDSVLENVYYGTEYDPDNPAGPECFAFGRSEKEMEPHIIVKEAGQAVSDVCAGCEMNEFGSADRGRGKACRNTRRLAMIPAGTFNNQGKLELFDEDEHYESTTIGFMKLPVTSVRGYANFVKQIASTLKRPPFGVVTKVSVAPDAKSQFRVLFEPMGQVPDELMAIIIERNKEASSTIDFPYQLDEEEPQPKKAARRSRAATKPESKNTRAAGKPSATRARRGTKY